MDGGWVGRLVDGWWWVGRGWMVRGYREVGG